jgi:hypothetical protein
MELIQAKHTEEAGHWYEIDGTPAYTIIGANGKERATTLRDAKKMSLLPSVTTIMKEAAKPGLDNWKQNQVILSSLTLPLRENEPEADYIERIKKDASEQARKAAERGTQIHAWVQDGFEDIFFNDREGLKFFTAAYNALSAISLVWISEKSFATAKYAGKVDLHTPGFVVDIKTTDKDLTGIKTWPEHAMQLAAYRQGLGMDTARCFILYINYQTETCLLEVPEADIVKGMKMFNALTDYFYAKTGL